MTKASGPNFISKNGKQHIQSATTYDFTLSTVTAIFLSLIDIFSIV